MAGPADSAVASTQRWTSLAFIHWRLDPERIQRTLPPGFQVEKFEGAAYLGLVPFRMNDVRLRGPWPFPHNFCETNLRTYVIGPDGETGVWFYSLEANDLLAVIGARLWYGLPYFHAKMELHEHTTGCYGETERIRVRNGYAQYRVAAQDDLRVAKEGTLEHFLLERYRLYSQKRGRVWAGMVRHDPYTYCSAKILDLHQSLSLQAGLEVGEPDLCHWSPGVTVETLRPYPLDAG